MRVLILTHVFVTCVAGLLLVLPSVNAKTTTDPDEKVTSARDKVHMSSMVDLNATQIIFPDMLAPNFSNSTEKAPPIICESINKTRTENINATRQACKNQLTENKGKQENSAKNKTEPVDHLSISELESRKKRTNDTVGKALSLRCKELIRTNNNLESTEQPCTLSGNVREEEQNANNKTQQTGAVNFDAIDRRIIDGPVVTQKPCPAGMSLTVDGDCKRPV